MNVKNKSISTDARRRAAALLETLSVEEKLRQLGCTTLSGCEEPLEEKDLAGGIGAVALLDIRLKPKALACWLREIQEYIMAHSDHRIPALFHCEALGGPVVPDTCLFPNSIGLGATFAPQTVYSMADTIRRQMRAMGIRHALSPVLDVAKDLRWGRVNETYGGDPTLSAMMSCAYVDGLQGDDLRTGVAATAKHFLGYSQTTGGLNLTRTLADSRELREVFAKPFEAAIRKSGIRTVMITGDHKVTACAVAREIGIWHEGDRVLSGSEISTMTEEQLGGIIEETTVFARVSPSDKLKIVRAFKKRGHITAMTGDGVNDAPAVKEADIGVSMGISGTDVTKEASDVILMDDNFATLVTAVKEGRVIYQNIRKFIRYLLSCNIGEVLTMFLGILMGMPVVLLPTQLLLVNLVTDGLPAIALGLEPPEPEAMQKPPRRPDESFFSDGLMGRIFFRGILIGICTLGAFSAVVRTGGTLEAARTAALCTLILSQLVHVFECKSERRTLFSMPYGNNLWLVGAVLVSVAVLAAAVAVPMLRVIFSTVMLTRPQWYIALGFSLTVPLCSSIAGLFRRKKQD